MKFFKFSFIALFLLLGLSIDLAAQEEVTDLRYAQSAYQSYLNSKTETTSFRSANYERGKFIYIIDTLQLPFFDDFSKNQIKTFNANINDPNVSLKINYDFSVNGFTPHSLNYMSDTTQSTLKTLSGDIIQSNNPPLFITYFINGIPVSRDTGWTNILESFDESTGLVSFDTLTPDVSVINTPDTFYKVADNNTLWVPPTDTFDSNISAPFINNVYAKARITQGVATFDGTDRKGFPYDITTETTYGEADQLVSKPIYLDSNMTNVFLSFFYQAGGNGNLPDEEDSLIVDFFDVQDSVWRHAWSITGPTEEDTNFSKQVYLKVDGRRYLRPGFRFRFRNYATLSGSFDHWHIDYIRLMQNRDTVSEDTIFDGAFVDGINTFLKDFTSVPYLHYLQNPAFFEKNQVRIKLNNLSNDSINIQGLRYEIFDPNNNLVISTVTSAPNLEAFQRLNVNIPITEPGLFPDLGTSSADFKIRCRYSTSGIGNQQQINDTITTIQSLRNYYAYDDGTAEKAYALTGAGLRLAYEFNTPIRDTLKAVYFNFPQILHDENEELNMEILVWESLEAEPIYRSQQLVEPTYTNANQFLRIKLEQPVVVQDRFFVGYRQLDATKIYIGLDVNTNASNFLRYEINGTWFESSVNGSIMIRPHFSDQDLLGAEEIKRNENVNNRLSIFPNPANSFINLELIGHTLERIEIYDLNGRMIKRVDGSENLIDINSVSDGFYIIKALGDHGSTGSGKLIIQR
jgi:hypothetical protein